MRKLRALLILVLIGAIHAQGAVQIIAPRGFPIAAASSGGGADVAFLSNGTRASGTASSGTPSEPAGASANTVFIALALCASSGTITRPSGWTGITGMSGTQGSMDYDVSYIRRGGSAPDLTWQFGSSVFHQVFIVAYNGCTTSGSPIDNSDQLAGLSTAPNPPSINAINANSLGVTLVAHWGGANPFVAPAGFTMRTAIGSQDGAIADSGATLYAAGATVDPATWTGPGSNTDSFVATITLKD